MAYSTERRAAVLKKLEPPNAVPLRQLAKEEGISEATRDYLEFRVGPR